MIEHTISTSFYGALQGSSKIRVHCIDIIETRCDFDYVRARAGKSFGQDDGKEHCQSLEL
jgi:hypothetical protein